MEEWNIGRKMEDGEKMRECQTETLLRDTMVYGCTSNAIRADCMNATQQLSLLNSPI